MKKQPYIGRFRSVILCEDIRTEDNGKLMIIGVFSQDIVIPEVPASIWLRLYIEYFLPKGVTQQVDFYWHVSGEQASEQIGTITRTDESDGIVAVQLPSVALNISQAGPLRVDAVIENATRVTILERQIIIGPITAR